MKYFVLIFIFSFSKLFGQLDPPALKCLEVLPNGNVKLTWIPPQDPGNTFHSYEIYSSAFATGPFTSVSPTITPLGTNSFVHTSTMALGSGIYYYMIARSGPGGSLSSNHSDTLRTMFFNVLNAPVAKELVYNNIHQPKLATSANTFTIEKEYPIGTWSILKIQSGLSYFDTLSVCGDTIKYKVSLMDFSGCTSVSNKQGGFYNDTKYPEKPLVDSISVLPNGNTVLTWKIPLDKDIVKYEIQYQTAAGTFTAIDVVNGRNSVSYTYSLTSANDNTISIGVAAIDGCKNSSTVNYDLRTMLLKTRYDSCAYSTTLNWNEYLSMQKGILEYRVYYSFDGFNFKRVGKTTGTTFDHKNVNGGKTVYYFVRAVNKDSSITASSNRISFFTSQAAIPDYLYIKNVNVADKKTNQVNILIDTSKESKGLDILRSEDGIHFETIGFVTYAGSPNIVFNDENAEPYKKSYYYKAALRDACGNLRSGSNIAKTILLKLNEDEDDLFIKHLSWNDYLGFAAGVKEYKVYRIINDVTEQSAIGTIDTLKKSYSDNLEDLAPKGTKIEYFVEAVENAGNPYSVLGKSRSNIVDVYIEGRLFVPNAFVPGGSNTTWLPVTHFIDKNEYRVKVFNRWGNVVFETNSDKEPWDGSNVPPDVYVYLINYKNSRGEYKEVTGTVTLIK